MALFIAEFHDAEPYPGFAVSLSFRVLGWFCDWNPSDWGIDALDIADARHKASQPWHSIAHDDPIWAICENHVRSVQGLELVAAAIKGGRLELAV